MQEQTKYGVFTRLHTNRQEPILSINKATTKDGVEIYTLNTTHSEYREPLTDARATSKDLSQNTSAELKELIIQRIFENDKLLYLLKQDINTQHLSAFQQEVLHEVLSIVKDPLKVREYKLKELHRQLGDLNSCEKDYIEEAVVAVKIRFEKDREKIERKIEALEAEIIKD